MRVMAMFSVIPIGVGTSLSRYVAACERVLREAGLEPELHSHGTNVEGEWEVVFGALRRCHEVLHGMGAPRISTQVKLGTRTDRESSGEAMVRSVRDQLGDA